MYIDTPIENINFTLNYLKRGPILKTIFYFTALLYIPIFKYFNNPLNSPMTQTLEYVYHHKTNIIYILYNLCQVHIPRLCRAKGGCERHIVMASFSLAREIYIVGSSVWEIFRNYSKPCFTCFMEFPKIRGVLTCKQGSLFFLPFL